ncbi:hypothetical protein TNCV_3826931 [Trichonephila clavipes]|nr:hypothetical protein TNCV_3826931 [Trichonephila clavipes]
MSILVLEYQFSEGSKSFEMCTNCSETASPAHLLECLELTKQDLAGDPLLVLDFESVRSYGSGLELLSNGDVQKPREKSKRFKGKSFSNQNWQDGDQFNSCQVIYSQFGLAIHQNDHQARRRFVEWAQNEMAVVPDFHKRILFRDEAHFWLNGYVNKQNCRIWSEAIP